MSPCTGSRRITGGLPDARRRGNPGARRFKGYEADEIVGRNFSCFFVEEDRAAGLPQQALAAAAREGRFEAEGIRLRKDGSRFWVNAVIDPIRDEDGKLLGFAKITRDITERRAAQEQLEEARASLFQAQKMQALGELTGGIAHDFNNLMTVIRGSAELLRAEGLRGDRIGDAVEFFDLSHDEVHGLVCYCHHGYTMSPVATATPKIPSGN